MDQHAYRLRFEWGAHGLRQLAPLSQALVIVDVMRFTSAVDAACAAGAEVLPYRWADDTAAGHAAEHGALLAGRAEDGDLSLSPPSLRRLEPGSRVVLPSPNGSALSLGAHEAGVARVVAACIRNAQAVGRWLADEVWAGGGAVGVLAAGERWRAASGPLRPALEDLLGAGAVIDALCTAAGVDPVPQPGGVSPEALGALATWRGTVAVVGTAGIADVIAGSSSGREGLARGWNDDVDYCGAVGASTTVPVLCDGRYVDVARR